MTTPIVTTEISTTQVFDTAGNLIGTRETNATVTTYPTPIPPEPPVTVFKHPGAMYSAAHLAFTADHIGQEPWATQWAKVLNKVNDQGGVNNGRKYSDAAGWSITGVRAEVGRGAGGSNSEGDTDMFSDAMAALVQAMMWQFEGDDFAGEAAAGIINAWARTCTLIKFDQQVYSDGLLLAGWVGSLFGRAAELLRDPQLGLDVGAVTYFFREVIYRNTGNPTGAWGDWRGGGLNWLASMIDATIQMAVFNDDLDMYTHGHDWLDRMIPAWAYMDGDVNTWPKLAGGPISNIETYMDRDSADAADMISYWKKPTGYVQGLWGEICRDFHHAAMGFGAMSNALETVHIQQHVLGVDLYGRHGARILATTELTCGYMLDRIVGGANPPPGWVGQNLPVYSGAYSNSQVATFEVLYNHYVNRKGYGMPKTAQWLDQACRNHNYVVNLHMIGEGTTHRDNPA